MSADDELVLLIVTEEQLRRDPDSVVADLETAQTTPVVIFDKEQQVVGVKLAARVVTELQAGGSVEREVSVVPAEIPEGPVGSVYWRRHEDAPDELMIRGYHTPGPGPEAVVRSLSLAFTDPHLPGDHVPSPGGPAQRYKCDRHGHLSWLPPGAGGTQCPHEVNGQRCSGVLTAA